MPDKPLFDLTTSNISETFQHLLQVRDVDSTIYDALGDRLTGFRISGSFTTSGNVDIDGNLVVEGSLTAKEYIVSSSVTNITYQSISGSTIFGDTEDDTHEFVGHVMMQSASFGMANHADRTNSNAANSYLFISQSVASKNGYVWQKAGNPGTNTFPFLLIDASNNQKASIRQDGRFSTPLVYLSNDNSGKLGEIDGDAGDSSAMYINANSRALQLSSEGRKTFKINTDGTTEIGGSGAYGVTNFGDLTVGGNLNLTASAATLEVAGNISGSSTSTGSFGRLEIQPDTDATAHIGRALVGFGTNSDTATFGHIDQQSKIGFAQSQTGKVIVQTPSGQPIAFKIGGFDKMNLSSDGNLGVGIETATEKLHVVGNVFATGNISGSATSTGSFGFVTGNKLGIGTTSPDYSAHIVVNGNDRLLIQNLNAGSDNVIELKANAKSSFIFNNPSTGHLFIRTDVAAEDVILQNNSSGNVGIGNLSEASEKLHVVGNVFATGNISGSLTSTGSFGKLLGDGSSLTGIETDLSGDTTPQLGGDLDLNSNDITGTGNIDIIGNITAQNFIVSSSVTSIEYQSLSGSTIFGDTIDDIHQITGSVFITGSTNVSERLTATEIGAFKATGAINFDSQNMTNVDIDSGTITGITDLVVADGGTGVSTLTDGGVLLGSGTGAITAMAVLTDGQMIVGDGTTDPVAESGATLRTSIGVGTGDDVVLTSLETSGNISGSAVSTGSFGHLELANRDTDASFEFGRAHIGYIGHSDMAGFSHVDNNSATSFALAQSAAGKTIVQAKSGQPIAFKINNSDKVQISSAGNLGVGIETATEKLHVVGNIFATGNISGSSTSTGSFGSLVVSDKVQGNLEINGILTIPGISNLSSSVAAAIAGGDNLGNHTATDDINLDGNALTNVLHISASGNISGSATSTGSFGAVTIDGSKNIHGNSNGIGIFTNAIDGTGVTLSPDGTKSSTALTNNFGLGITHTGANGSFSALQINTGAGKVLWVGNDAKIGIKNSDPVTELDVRGTISGSIIRSAGTTNLMGNVSIGSATTSGTGLTIIPDGTASGTSLENNFGLAITHNGTNTGFYALQVNTGTGALFRVNNGGIVDFPSATKISGSATSTGSFGQVDVAGNITANQVDVADIVHVNNLTIRGAGNNVAIGDDGTGESLTEGTFGSVAIGSHALSAHDGASQNVAIGHNAMKERTNGSDNVAIGTGAGGTDGDDFGDKNVFIGLSTGLAINSTSSDGNVMIGNLAGTATLQSIANVLIGDRAGNTLTNSSRNVVIGNFAGTGNGVTNTTTENGVYLGQYAQTGTTNANGEIVLGTATGKGSNTATIGGDNITDIYMSEDLGAMVHVGNISGSSTSTGSFGILELVKFNGGIGHQENVNFGIGAGSTGGGDSNVAIGFGAGAIANAGSSINIAIGREAQGHWTDADGDRNIAIGYQAQYDHNGGDDNIAIGYQAMKNGEGSHNDNIAIGTDAMQAIGAGAARNIGMGDKVMNNLVGGTDNIGFGASALFTNVAGDYNVALGTEALYGINAESADKNVAVGYRAGIFIANGSTEFSDGDSNVFIGSETKPAADDESNQIIIGANAIGKGSNTALIGDDNITDIYMSEDLGATLHTGNVSGSATSTGSFGAIQSAGNITPKVDDSVDLGASNLRFKNIFTTDLQLSNEGKEKGNEVDGTTGSWTIQEGEEELYLLNRKNGKKYKFMLQEIK